MMTVSLAQPRVTLVGVVAARVGAPTSLRIGAVLFGISLTAAAAQASVPLPWTSVPLTFQAMVVLISGAALGSRLGALTQILYLLAGVAGMPVFAASPLLPQGAARLLGPTAGYLLAFPLAAYVAGRLAECGFGRHYWTSCVALAAGLTVIFGLGLGWLALWPGAPLGLDGALRAGLYPFVVVDLAKLMLAAALLPALWRLIGLRPTTRS